MALWRMALWRDAVTSQTVHEAAIRAAFEGPLRCLVLPSRPCLIHDSPWGAVTWQRSRRKASVFDKAWQEATRLPEHSQDEPEPYEAAERVLDGTGWDRALATIRQEFGLQLLNDSNAYSRVCLAALDAHSVIAEDLIWYRSKVSDPEPLNPWHPLIQAFHAGAFLFWVANEAVHVILGPSIYRDNRRWLHCETGLAVRWLDGSGFYFWHGLRVPPRVILQPPETITLQQILEERDEGLQQVLIERFGIERLLRDKERVTVKSAPWLISPWVDLELFGLPDDDEVIVEVTSPESGGKHVLQMCCRPETHRDDRGFLHCETGPAISWPGGSRLYFWHGEQVPEQAILCPHTLTPQQILQEPNAEVRRVMIERFGADRLIREAKTEMVDQSSWGTLYELEFDDDESLMMVEVTCPSTGRKYLLRVPPDITTAQRAVAWTFDLRPEDYQPAQQT